MVTVEDLLSTKKEKTVVGGISTPEGPRLITSEGEIVGTAAPPIRRGGRGGRGPRPSPTAREQAERNRANLESQRRAIAEAAAKQRALEGREVDILPRQEPSAIPGISRRPRSPLVIPKEEKKPRTREEFIIEQQQDILTQQFKSLTPEELEARALTPELTGIVGMSTEEGQRFTFTPTETQLKESRAAAKREFRELPLLQQASLVGGEVGTGLIRGGLGLGEAIFDIPTQAGAFFGTEEQVREEVRGTGKIFRSLVSEREGFREVRETPTGLIGTVSGFVPTVAATIIAGKISFTGFKGARAAGFTRGEALGEAVSVFSPIQLEKKIFTGIPAEAEVTPSLAFKPAEIVQISRQGEPGISLIGAKGRTPGVSLKGVGREIKLPTGEEFNVQLTAVRQPIIEIRGGTVTEGVLETVIPTATRIRGGEFPSVGEISPGVGIKFPSTRVAETISADLTRTPGFVGERPLGRVETPFGVREEFIFGTGTKLTVREGFPKAFPEPKQVTVGEQFVSELTGRGTRITLRPTDKDVGITKITTRAGRKPRTTQETVQDISSSLLGVQKSISVAAKQPPPAVTPKLDVLPGPGAFAVLRQQPSEFVGLGLFERTAEVGLPVPKPTQVLDIGIKEDFVGVTPTITGLQTPLITTKQKPLTAQIPSVIPSLGLGLIPAQVPKQVTPQIIGEVTEQITPVPIKPRVPTGFDFGFVPPKPPGRGLFLPFLPGLGFFDFPGRRVLPKKKLKRQPSLIAAVLGITAPTPALGEETGLAIRPVLR